MAPNIVKEQPSSALKGLNEKILRCRECPRLVAWRGEAARKAPRRFAGESYHARPVPGFGDARARMLVVGLAPAAHGANRTGRMFTGDQSGVWLYRALHRAGFASQAESTGTDDGLRLRDAFITASCRCAPPDNKPTPEELANCAGWLDAEVRHFLPRLRVVVALGAVAARAAADALARCGVPSPRPRPKFAHGAEERLERADGKPLILLMSYHPSQQNTFTGVLTEPMFDAVWSRARAIIAGGGG